MPSVVVLTVPVFAEHFFSVSIDSSNYFTVNSARISLDKILASSVSASSHELLRFVQVPLCTQPTP